MSDTATRRAAAGTLPDADDAGDAGADPASQYLTFQLGDDAFALGIGSVQEVIQCGRMTTVPVMPRFLRGLINRRGTVLPVIDLHARFGRPAARLGMMSCILVYELPSERSAGEIGLLVDAVSEVVAIDAARIEPPPEFGTGMRREFIGGVACIGGRFVSVLDPARAFDMDEMAALCDAAQDAAFA